MAEKKVYDADEIVKMAVGLIEPDVINADYNGDGKITSSDARTNNRISSGLSVDAPVVGNSGIQGNTGANNNIYAVSNAYQNQADAIYKKIQETPDFKYDFNEDAVFNALREQYMKDGKLAAENVQGQAAALSGGYGNSYGATAAGQAYMSAIDSLYDAVPELQQVAYSRYKDKKAEDFQNWQIMQNRADTERGYAATERDYQDSRDAYLWELALQKAQLGDYSALKGLGVDTSESEYSVNLSKALQLAELGDYSGLKALGVDTTESEYNVSLSKALQLAEFGDYSGLQALGIDTSTAEKQNALDFAMAAAQYGDYSFLKALGIDTSEMETPKYAYYSSGGPDDKVINNEEVAPKKADETYEPDKLDDALAIYQGIVDDPNSTEKQKQLAKSQMGRLKEQHYGN